MADLRDPWASPHEAQAILLRYEALREIIPGHELAGKELRCIALCTHCSQVVFACDDGTFAIVRLTWRAADQPPWPITRRFRSDESLQEAMDQHQHPSWQDRDSA